MDQQLTYNIKLEYQPLYEIVYDRKPSITGYHTEYITEQDISYNLIDKLFTNTVLGLAQPGDIIQSWRINYMGMSTKDILIILTELERRGVNVELWPSCTKVCGV